MADLETHPVDLALVDVGALANYLCDERSAINKEPCGDCLTAAGRALRYLGNLPEATDVPERGDTKRAGRREAAEVIISTARNLQALVDDDPELLRDAAIAGKIAGLWMAAKIADRQTYFRRRAERPTAKPEATDD